MEEEIVTQENESSSSFWDSEETLRNFIEETHNKLCCTKRVTEELREHMEYFMEHFEKMKQQVRTLVDAYFEEECEDRIKLAKLFNLFEKLEQIPSKFEKLEEMSKVSKEETGTFQELHEEDQKQSQYNIVENTEPFQCPICIEDIEVGKGYSIPICKHQYCLDCLEEYTKTLITEGRVLKISCPFPRCDSELHYHNVRKIVDKDSFQKYETFTLLTALRADPDVRWCPNPKGCSNALVGEGNGNNKLICNVCEYEFCFECMEAWHSGTCEDYEQWKIENGKVDTEFVKWVKENKAQTKKCPKCKIKIQKESGCNHMTCTFCRYQFCWLCSGKYTENHYKRFNPMGCPGLQFRDSKKISRKKIVIKKVGLGTGIVLSIPFVITAGVIVGPFYGGYRIQRKIRKGY